MLLHFEIKYRYICRVMNFTYEISITEEQLPDLMFGMRIATINA